MPNSRNVEAILVTGSKRVSDFWFAELIDIRTELRKELRKELLTELHRFLNEEEHTC